MSPRRGGGGTPGNLFEYEDTWVQGILAHHNSVKRVSPQRHHDDELAAPPSNPIWEPGAHTIMGGGGSPRRGNVSPRRGGVAWNIAREVDAALPAADPYAGIGGGGGGVGGGVLRDAGPVSPAAVSSVRAEEVNVRLTRVLSLMDKADEADSGAVTLQGDLEAFENACASARKVCYIICKQTCGNPQLMR